MLQKVIELLSVSPNGVYVDGTLGLGGHAEAVLNKLNPDGRFIGIDQDAQALAKAKERLSRFSNQCRFIHSNFKNIPQILRELNIRADGILLDLGISSYQVDDASRGFSIRQDGPLDMRMDQSAEVSAYDLVNSATEKELEQIIREYGEERWSRRIANQIVEERMKAPITTTADLKRCILRAIPPQREYQKIHPATRTFQAIRIAVNQELDVLKAVAGEAVNFLNPGGKFVIISFHSLEDRIVKTVFKDLSRNGIIKILTDKPLVASDEEIEKNPRARSAKLRALERL